MVFPMRPAEPMSNTRTEDDFILTEPYLPLAWEGRDDCRLPVETMLSACPLTEKERTEVRGSRSKIISVAQTLQAFCASELDLLHSSRIKGDALRRTSPRASRALSLSAQDSVR